MPISCSRGNREMGKLGKGETGKLKGNHNLMAKFSRFRKYQTFDLIELHNMNKCQNELTEYSSYGKTVFTINGPSNTTFEILTF